MKKIILTVALAISSSIAFGQTVDWSVSQIISPTELNSTQSSGTPIVWDVVLKNNGTDSVFIGDSIWIQWAITTTSNVVINGLLFPGPTINTYSIIVSKKNMGVNDTVHYKGNFTANFGISPSADVKAYFKSHVTNRKRGLNFETTQTNNSVSNPIVWYNWQKWSVGVNSIFKNSSLAIYPNPAKDNLNVNLEFVVTNANVNVSVFDMLGKEVLSESFNSNFENMNINTSTLSKGVYTVKVSNGNSVTSSKLVIE